MGRKLRLIVADDHAIVREGLCRVIGSMDCCVVCAEAADGHEAVSLALAMRPDMVLMDLAMPHMSGLDATSEIKRQAPDTKILILTGHDERHLLRLAVKAGADGYLHKNADKVHLNEAILTLASTGRYLPGLPVEEVCSHDAEGCPSTGSDLTRLTRREREILGLVADGLKNREISEKLCISVKTVEKHRANLMKKLGLRSVAELVSWALRTGQLVSGES